MQARRYALQALLYAAFAVVIGGLSVRPTYHYTTPDLAVVKVSFSHAAERLIPCVQLTPAEIAAMPPNERRPAKCERERHVMRFELDVDGEALFATDRAPSGLWNDGPASIYHRFEIAPGEHEFTLRLRDSADQEEWSYVASRTLDLQAGRYTTIRFRAQAGGFEFR